MLRHFLWILSVYWCYENTLAAGIPNHYNSSSTTNSTQAEVHPDPHAGVSSIFDQALHDPTIAMQTSGTQFEITCPAATAWNQIYAGNTSTKAPSDDELEQRWIVSYMDQHPDQTLWELFTKTLDEDIRKWLDGPAPVEVAFDNTAGFVAEVLKQFVLMIWAAFKWIVKFPFQPVKEWNQVTDFGTELWDGTMLAGSLFAKNAMDGLKTVVGGLLLHLLLHSAEFTAESILLVGAGFQVIHALMHGVEVIAGALPPIVENSVMSVLVFIHMLDDPLLILTPILTSTAQSVQAVKGSSALSGDSEEDGGFSSNDGSTTMTLPPDTLIPVSSTCPLPESELGNQPLTYSRLCLTSNPSDVRKLVFGTTKASNEMTREERLEAYIHVRKFWCCYGSGISTHLPDSILEDIPGREKWEGKSYWQDVEACGDLQRRQPLPASGRLTIEV